MIVSTARRSSQVSSELIPKSGRSTGPAREWLRSTCNVTVAQITRVRSHELGQGGETSLYMYAQKSWSMKEERRCCQQRIDQFLKGVKKSGDLIVGVTVGALLALSRIAGSARFHHHSHFRFKHSISSLLQSTSACIGQATHDHRLRTLRTASYDTYSSKNVSWTRHTGNAPDRNLGAVRHP